MPYNPTRHQEARVSPEAQAYEYAYQQWEGHQLLVKTLDVQQVIGPDYPIRQDVVLEALEAFPRKEARPAALGMLIRHISDHWARGAEGAAAEAAQLIEKTLPDLSEHEQAVIQHALNARSPLQYPTAITLEEFPSRTWRRAIASGRVSKMAQAAMFSALQIMRLSAPKSCSPNGTSSKGGPQTTRELTCVSSVADHERSFDLVALTPTSMAHLKNRIMNNLRRSILDEQHMFQNSKDLPARTWALHADEKGVNPRRLMTGRLRRLLLAKAMEDSKSRSRDLEIRHIGCVLYRLGRRKAAIRCASELEFRAWHIGWQHQPVSPVLHAKARAFAMRSLRPDSDPEEWKHEPALASSMMSLPLWLADTDGLLDELTALFRAASEFPWVFPRLHHVFQWHLAMAGKWEILRACERIAKPYAMWLTIPASGEIA